MTRTKTRRLPTRKSAHPNYELQRLCQENQARHPLLRTQSFEEHFSSQKRLATSCPFMAGILDLLHESTTSGLSLTQSLLLECLTSSLSTRPLALLQHW